MLLIGAAQQIDDAIPDDPAPVVQGALWAAARALCLGGPADFDEETIAYLDRMGAALVSRLEEIGA